MGLNLNKVRRQRLALELLCAIHKIDDSVLNAFIENGDLPKENVNFAEKMKAAKEAKKDKK